MISCHIVNANLCREHLYRRHALAKNICPRCLQDLKTPAALVRHHQETPNACARNNSELPAGTMGIAQREKIRAMARMKEQENLSEEEKWAVIYRTIFNISPEDEIPSPCAYLIFPVRTIRIVLITKSRL
jgi:hypothetical protein